MASVQHLRGFIRDRLTAAAEDIILECEKTIMQYEKKLKHLRRLQEITWSPVVKLHVTDIPQQHSCNQEELLTAQQLCNQEGNSSPESPQIKEEQQELCSSQQGEQAVQKQATDTITVTLIHEESDHGDPEPDGDQLLSHSSDTVVFVESKAKEILEVINKCVQDEAEIGHQRRVLDRTCNPVVKLYRTDPPQQHVCKLKEVLADQQLYNQERNSSPEQENPESPLIKEGQEELCGSQQGKQALQTQTDKVRPGLGLPAPVEPIMAPLNVSALSADSYLTLKTVTFTGKKLYPCNTCGKTFTTMFSFKRHSTIHTGEKPHLCTTCGRRFRQIYPLTVHMRTHRGELPYICNTCGKVFK